MHTHALQEQGKDPVGLMVCVCVFVCVCVAASVMYQPQTWRHELRGAYTNALWVKGGYRRGEKQRTTLVGPALLKSKDTVMNETFSDSCTLLFGMK